MLHLQHLAGRCSGDGRMLREVLVNDRPWLRSPEGCRQWLVCQVLDARARTVVRNCPIPTHVHELLQTGGAAAAARVMAHAGGRQTTVRVVLPSSRKAAV